MKENEILYPPTTLLEYRRQFRTGSSNNGSRVRFQIRSLYRGMKIAVARVLSSSVLYDDVDYFLRTSTSVVQLLLTVINQAKLAICKDSYLSGF